ncbi:MAG: hypothetical protein KGR69_02485 [Verrucomicrobia bacterium]|nr:hypothetical protein [Verrucomicrobiota bacterium]
MTLSRIPVVIALLSVSLALPATAASGKKSSKDPATIYVIRGGGGYFPNLGTVINSKFEEQGLDVVDFRYHERGGAAKQIAKAYRDGQLPHGIILIGYSLGGCGVIDVSNTLKKDGIPVRLLFLIETINPLQTVPSNVQECFNLYHFPAILGAPVRADSPQTKLTNFEAYTDAGLGLEYSHFAMPFVEEVHELIAARLVTAINTKAPKTSNPANKTARTSPASSKTSAPAVADTKKTTKKPAGEEVAASGTVKESKPLFSGLFAKAAPKEEPETDEKKATTSKKSGSRR